MFEMIIIHNVTLYERVLSVSCWVVENDLWRKQVKHNYIKKSPSKIKMGFPFYIYVNMILNFVSTF